ncbi:hydrophobic surface binding protein A-domain-containing protein [Panaeolus papilionaceus]|nr:hydrophobic surface binding protein A-domain-containing protein [Panaeolus papilionaceus]
MQLSSVFVSLTLWASFVLGEPLSRSSIATVNSDITVLESNIASLNTLIGGFSGSFFQAASIRAACDSLNKANSKTTQDIEDASPFSVDEGNNIYAAIHTSLGPAINNTFDTLIAKKPMFSSLGVTNVVRSSLQDLENGIVPFVNSLINAAPAEQKDRTAQEARGILAGLKNCESIYSS